MAKSIRYIMQALRTGKTPEKLGGKVCGKGAVKAAYFFDSPIGGFVIKENAQNGLAGDAEKNAPKWIYEYGARGCRTYKCGQYIIQEYVTPIKHKTRFDFIEGFKDTEAYQVFKRLTADRRNIDIHMGNVGVDSKGQLVVFDW